jgi:hypothetical protein
VYLFGYFADDLRKETDARVTYLFGGYQDMTTAAQKKS